MSTFVMPGQGSQIRGMGKGLFERFPEITQAADDVLGYSVRELCLKDKQHRLGDTRYTQPALFTVNALHYMARTGDGGGPEYLAGHSLGEYDALFAAGAFDFETGLRLVAKRGELMSEVGNGSMAAVLGLTAERVEAVLAERGLETIDIANYNAPTQIVLSGPKSDIDGATKAFEAAGAMYIPLFVSGAFHSRYMREVGDAFAAFLDGFTFADPAIPVISNVHARPCAPGQVKDNLIEQLTHPVRWTETIRYLWGLGETDFEEIGPGDVLTKLVVRIRDEAEPLVLPESAPGVREPDAGAPTGSARQVTAPEEKATIPPVAPAPAETSPAAGPRITAATLGSASFRDEYGLTYGYYSGSMAVGISSVEMVVRMGKAGMMGFFGTAGLRNDRIEEAIERVQSALADGEPYGMNLVHMPASPEREEQLVELFMRHGVHVVEASAFMGVTPALVRYRAEGLARAADGAVSGRNRIIAKLSRPEVAEAMLSPAPERIVSKLVEAGKLTTEQAALLAEVPLATDIVAEADSGGHTDGAVALALLPSIVRLRDELVARHGYARVPHVGAGGGIGTPEAAAAAFVLGADFIVTGSINQCTVEGGTSDAAKDLLAAAGVQDTAYAPAPDMFEMDAKVQVLKKGVFYPARANKLADLFRMFDSLDALDGKTRRQLEEKFFHRGFDEVFAEATSWMTPEDRSRLESDPKRKMATVFKWYMNHSSVLALDGVPEGKVDYQIQCGPALGSFNSWVKGTELEDWRARHVDEIAVKLMEGTAACLNARFAALADVPLASAGI